nr:putative late blight resistance protein homolog R1B-14 [Ipomoea batatas]
MLVFSGLKMLRVLDLSLIKCWYGLPNELEDLVHLRYLSLSALGSIGNFQLTKLRNLQTLIFRSWRKGCRLQLPRNILKLPWLRHVHVDKISSLYLPKLVQENLQTLLWLKVIGLKPKTMDFTKVPKLKELWVYIDNELLPGAFDSLVNLNLLEKLKIEMGSVKRFYFPTALPENLKKLTLRSTYLPWKDMDIIGRLKNLEVLKLKNFAFYGPEWKLAYGLFPELKIFVIAHSNLKCWNADAENFPKLECLILKFCWDLKELPIDGFGNTLRLIEIDSCYPSLVKSAKKIQEEQQDLGNDELVIRDLGAKVEEEFKFVEVLQWHTIPRETASPLGSRKFLSNLVLIVEVLAHLPLELPIGLLWVLIDNELLSNAFDSLVHLNSLQKLKLKVDNVRFYFPTDLPKNLKRLTLSGTFLPWKDMNIIERLPNLEDGLPNKKSSKKMGAEMMEMDKKMKAIVGDEEAMMEVDENLMIL